MTDKKAAAAIFGVGPRNGVGAELCHQAARARRCAAAVEAIVRVLAD